MTGVGLSAVGLGVAVVGAAIDARTGRVPNWLTLGALVTAPAVAFVLQARTGDVSAGLSAAAMSVLGAVICGLGPLVAFLKGGLGGGDVKLLAAIGALLGFRLGLDAEFYGFVVGALYVPAKLAWQGRLFATVVGGLRALANPFRRKATRSDVPEGLKMRVRLGPAICVGTILALVLAQVSA